MLSFLLSVWALSQATTWEIDVTTSLNSQMCKTELQNIKVTCAETQVWKVWEQGVEGWQHDFWLRSPPVLLRWAGTATLCCNAWTWTHLSWNNKIQRNCMGLKTTARMRSWEKFWTQKIQRDQKPQLLLLKILEQKQGTAHAPCTPPSKGWAKHLSRWPDPRTHPSPHPI